MKVTIRVLSFIALAAVVLYLLALLLVVVFQSPLKELLGAPDEVIGLWHFPAGSLLSGLRMVLTVTVLCIFAGNHKVGIWLELVLLGVNQVLWPPISAVANLLQTMTIGRYGAAAIANRSYVSSLTSYVSFLFGIAFAIYLVVCGMSIAYKVMYKKSLRVEDAQ